MHNIEENYKQGHCKDLIKIIFTLYRAVYRTDQRDIYRELSILTLNQVSKTLQGLFSHLVLMYLI